MKAQEPGFIASFTLILLASGASAKSPGPDPRPGKTPSAWTQELESGLETQPAAAAMGWVKFKKPPTLLPALRTDREAMESR